MDEIQNSTSGTQLGFSKPELELDLRVPGTICENIVLYPASGTHLIRELIFRTHGLSLPKMYYIILVLELYLLLL